MTRSAYDQVRSYMHYDVPADEIRRRMAEKGVSVVTVDEYLKRLRSCESSEQDRWNAKGRKACDAHLQDLQRAHGHHHIGAN